MKRILITGANSYIGVSFEHYLSEFPDEYQVDTIDMMDNSWQQNSFKGYDCIFHVAGIAHQDNGRISNKNKKLYFRVNCDLAVETAKKAKADGVAQFIFMSTMSVYGQRGSVVHPVVITRDTKPNPQNAYGESKLKAEEGILSLQEESFHVCILRPPMIYGPGCKGNYKTLEKFAKTFPLFPDIKNQRSMLHIDRLCETVKDAVDTACRGILFPQDSEYICTSRMVEQIAQENGKKMLLTKVFNPALRLLSHFSPVINKTFGSLVYQQDPASYVNKKALKAQMHEKG